MAECQRCRFSGKFDSQARWIVVKDYNPGKSTYKRIIEYSCTKHAGDSDYKLPLRGTQNA